MKVNLFSNTIPEGDSWSNMWRPVPELEFVRNQMEWDGVTVFVDDLLPMVDKVKSKYKIAWLVEPPVIKNAGYRWMLNTAIRELYDAILSYHPQVIDIADGRSHKFPFGACWITEENTRIYEKSKMLSIVASFKNFAPGHKLRHELIRDCKALWEVWGNGYNEFPHTEEGRLIPFKDYMYSVVIENCQIPNYFTDKILDCFATGTIPIYWGCPNAHDFWNMDGVITFKDRRDLEKILSNISREDYESRYEAMEDNLRRVTEYDSPDRNLLEFIKEQNYEN